MTSERRANSQLSLHAANLIIDVEIYWHYMQYVCCPLWEYTSSTVEFCTQLIVVRKTTGSTGRLNEVDIDQNRLLV